MLINAIDSGESRIAIVDNGALAEFYVERSSLGSQLGNIYKGRVVNVEPSIGAAFIDFGGPRHGFLSVQDIFAPDDELPDDDEVHETRVRRGAPRPSSRSRPAPPKGERRRRAQRSIADLLRRGQEVVVQVAKDGIGTKGPSLTTYLSLPGRHLVLMPGVPKKGVSRKIDDDGERERLKRILDELEVGPDVGAIVRTAGAGTTGRELRRDLRYLNELWKMIKERSDSEPAPSLLYQESDLVIRTLRDIYDPTTVDAIVVDSERLCKRATDFLKVIAPRQQHVIKAHTSSKPLFHAYGVEKELEGLFAHRIELKSGGYIFIEQTEAIVSIDINSGRFREEGDLEETAFKINLEAAAEIARHLRLRDLGGVIINDFIDMRDGDHRRQLEKAFRNALKSDRARIKVARMSPFGIIEMTRQRLRPSLKGSSYVTCRQCKGTGLVANTETVGLALMRTIRLKTTENKDLIEAIAHPTVAEYLLNERRGALMDLEEATGKVITVKFDSTRAPGEFEVVTKVLPPQGH